METEENSTNWAAVGKRRQLQWSGENLYYSRGYQALHTSARGYARSFEDHRAI